MDYEQLNGKDMQIEIAEEEWRNHDLRHRNPVHRLPNDAIIKRTRYHLLPEIWQDASGKGFTDE